MITYAQNYEDVMLERLFGEVERGFYIDVGAWDPKIHSVTQHFYDKGWRGVNVEPIPYRHKLFVDARPEDVNLNNAVGLEEGLLRFFECPADSALSTLDEHTAASMRERGLTIEEYDVHTLTLASIFDRFAPSGVEFLKIDIEGFEDRILNNFDLRTYRPRALVVESTIPAAQPAGFDRFDELDAWSSWEPNVLSQGYVFAHFDGLNRFYVREEDRHLADRLKLPPGIFDHFTPYTELQKLAERDADRKAKDEVIERLQLEILAIDGDRRAKDEVIARLASEIELINHNRGELLSQITTLTGMIHSLQRSGKV
ncbi:FkbM family methyltransferase [Rhizobium sp. FY34]|uniref:FkbM family methyltransferase n=1 Tax=Rhizobium sp. FY34 TaxID=2562309 RepID=UPI0010C0AB5D|nr:FkbM family methyltransferase [Rhizobium sp. FY34]